MSRWVDQGDEDGWVGQESGHVISLVKSQCCWKPVSCTDLIGALVIS